MYAKRTRLLFCLISVMLMCLVLFVGCNEAANVNPNLPSQDTTTSEPLESTDGNRSIYPEAWQTMNAAIVEWGVQNNEEYIHNYNSETQIKYVGVEVKFIKLFTETASYQFQFDPNSPPFSFVMIREDSLSMARQGEQSLIFMSQLLQVPLTDGRYLNVPAVLEDEAGIYSPVFAIKQDKLIIPDSAYHTNAEGSYRNIMGLLQSGNNYIKQYYSNDPIEFRNGMTLQELERFFDYCCRGEFKY